MNEKNRRLFWLESAIGGLSAVLAIVTLITREWVEALTGWDPDGGNGSFEWFMVAVLIVVALVLGFAARREWQRRLNTAGAAV